jgi:hypothetical protein|tara:strand:+ start:508029 stop:508334 length:306 start_codon:yes stop_codon:yes gene_type:complete
MSFLTTFIEHLKDFRTLNRHPKPERDWFLLLALACILAGLSVGWNVWSYYEFAASTTKSHQVTTTPTFTVPAVEAVEAAFMKREEEAARYRDTYRFVDPSL